MFARLKSLLGGPNSVSSRTLELPVSAAAAPATREAKLALSGGPLEALERGRWFRFTGANRAEFYRYLRDHIPIVSSGIWTWVRLCATAQRLELEGGEASVRRARRLAEGLARRAYPRRDGDARGFERLTEAAFWELFTLGRVALRVHLLPDRSGIARIEPLDPYRIAWRRGPQGRLAPWLEDEAGSWTALDPATLFYRTLTNDLHRPGGVDPLASIPFVVEVEQRMLADMARSSHNAGTQRLQVRMTPPERQPGEDYETYTRRANSYFDQTMAGFRELGPDDNVFTWSDVEVRTIGGPGDSGRVWKLNREQVIEDVITGLKLFPWALGRSHGTTKNWIYAQYNLLMQIVDSVQRLGSELVEWLLGLELALAGTLATPRWHFAPNQDPFLEERNRARLLALERVERLVAGGFISRDQGARELGYSSAHRGEGKAGR